MGDRANPMKFGPEWLRNLSREPSNPGTSSGRDSSGSGSPGAAPPPGNGAPPTSKPSTSSSTSTPKVLLAKLRYGREEMLALYDNKQTLETPSQLKTISVLYQPRAKPPYALNTFEDDSRDMRGTPAPGSLPNVDRYGIGRGRPQGAENRGRVMSTTEGRGRAKGFNRPTVGRGPNWHPNARNSYSGMPDDDPNLALRPWSNTNPSSTGRPAAEQADWANKQPYRNKRQTNTNWRQQHNREEGEEWRSAEGGRRQQDKWGSEWPNQDKSWTSNRRTWVGGDTAEDSLPEWAVENAEACGGTFDSSGAFHGYSNDDSNIPKNVEPYALTRSHTHGSFVRSKTAEEGSDEWWASEKAKKLSPKRFDASDIKFKKPPGVDGSVDKPTNTGSVYASASATSTGAIPKETSKAGGDRANPKDKNKNQKSSLEENVLNNGPQKQEQDKSERDFMEETSKNINQAERPFESDVEEKPSDEKGNFQSVILTSNNILRQKHQNIGTPTESPKKQPTGRLMHYYGSASAARLERERAMQKDKENNRIVEDILQMSLDDNIPQSAMSELLKHSNTTMSPGLANTVHSMAQVNSQNLQMKMTNPMLNQNVPSSGGLQAPGAQSSIMPPIGMASSMLNASLGLQVQGMPPLSNPGMLSSNLQSIGSANLQHNLTSGQSAGLPSGLPMPGLQSGGLQSNGLPSVQNMPGFQSGSGILPNMGNNSLFLGQGSTNNTLPNSNDIGNHANNQNMFPMHGLSSNATPSFNAAIFGNLMNQPPPPLGQNLYDQWYYEDPNKTIQGPFPSKEMLNWLRAGFFSPSLMVRRACEAIMRPLGTYGPMPFGQGDLLGGPFPMGGAYDMRPQQSHDNLMNPQPGLGLDVPTSMGMPTMPFIRRPHVAYNHDNHNQLNIRVAIASVGHQYRGIIPHSLGEYRPLPPPIPMPIPHQIPEPIPMPDQNNRVQGLWGQPSNNADMMWMQGMNSARNENRNNSAMFFWDQQPSSAIQPNTLLPEDIAKEMKTEEEILAQMRANQPPVPTPPALSFLDDQPLPPVPDDFTASADLNMKELQKLIQSDVSGTTASVDEPKVNKTSKTEQNGAEVIKTNKSADAKQKAPKVEEKKSKDNGNKSKAKKNKDEKKDDAADAKIKDDEFKIEKRSAEPSPSPNAKKDEKSKKDLEKEKKDWLKDGFTIVKGAEKNKDNKKKAEEARAAEEAERKRKEEEKIAEEEVRKRQMETLRKQQEIQNQQQQQARQAELISRKAPWSATNQGVSAPFPGPTLAEIQRLEREKKLEQMKEQQQMMQIIAQQQQAALAREQVFGGQEMQAGLGWAKKPTNSTPSQPLSEIQAEARKQAAAAAAAAAAAREEAQPTPPPVVNIVPWGNTALNGPTPSINTSGFWDTPVEPPKPVKPVEPPKQEPKPKKKVTVVTPAKKENSPSADFDNWCTNALTTWRDSNIDVPTFITFLRDIESPYEVKDYVKCYLGDSKESSDFARQFLERRSRLLRVGMVTPSDDLCSPAIAINPRTNSGTDYTDVKSKGKKTKKNKMLKVDARNILGFSVTASEDRINVGDIDTV